MSLYLPNITTVNFLETQTYFVKLRIVWNYTLKLFLVNRYKRSGFINVMRCFVQIYGSTKKLGRI